jgi:hypothetical protein
MNDPQRDPGAVTLAIRSGRSLDGMTAFFRRLCEMSSFPVAAVGRSVFMISVWPIF